MKNKYVRILVLISRIVIAATFMFSGFSKAVDPVGSSIKFGEYFSALNLDFLQNHTMILSIFLSSIEFTIGASILWGAYRKLAAWGAFLFMLIFTPLTLWLAITNAVSDCGCFGDLIILDNWQTFYKNLFLIIFSIILVFGSKYIRPLFNYHIRWIPSFYSFLFSMFFSIYAMNHLPLLDFRPYKIGISILNEMGINQESNKEYILVYEKEGQKKEFSINNLPAEGEGWEFVETIVKNNNNFTPTIKDFFITNESGDEITTEILDNDSLAVVLLSYNLEKADISELQKIIDLKQNAAKRNIPFYLLTANNPISISYWNDITAEDFNYIFSDATVIETIIRSNPGVMVLKKDTIIDKVNIVDFPDSAKMNSYFDDAYNSKINKIEPKTIILLSLLIYFIPILVLLLFNKSIEILLYKNENKKPNIK